MHIVHATLLALLAPITAAAYGWHGCSGPESALATSFPDPNVDPFYQQTADIANARPGQVLRSRQVITTAAGRSVKSFQLFYRTTNQQGNAVGTVASIWVPATPYYPPKVFSYNQAEDSLNLDCTPSWAFVNSSSVLETDYQQTDFIINWALEQGYYVVVSDNEGPDSAWLVGNVEGKASIDGVRATIDFAHLPISQAQVVFFGYSGGAHTSVWASSLAESYAPELKVVGAAFGGTPVDLAAAYYLLNGAAGALLAGGALFGLANGYPELNATLNSILTPDGAATAAKLRAPNNCIPAIIIQYLFVNFDTFFTEPPLNNSVVASIVANESLLSNVSTIPVPVPKFPRFQWHSPTDTVVPYGPEAVYVEQQCAAGADIRFVSIPDGTHSSAFTRGAAGALEFVQQAFNGSLTSVSCGSNITIPVLGSAEAIEVLGITNDLALIEALSSEQ